MVALVCDVDHATRAAWEVRQLAANSKAVAMEFPDGRLRTWIASSEYHALLFRLHSLWGGVGG